MPLCCTKARSMTTMVSTKTMNVGAWVLTSISYHPAHKGGNGNNTMAVTATYVVSHISNRVLSFGGDTAPS
jgi:hypothetical protein